MTLSDRDTAMVDLRQTLAWLGEEIHTIANPVDPVLEMTAICKAFDNSKAIVADSVAGYPNARMIGNLWATKERCAKLFGVGEFKDIKHKLLACLRTRSRRARSRRKRHPARRSSSRPVRSARSPISCPW